MGTSDLLFTKLQLTLQVTLQCETDLLLKRKLDVHHFYHTKANFPESLLATSWNSPQLKSSILARYIEL